MLPSTQSDDKPVVSLKEARDLLGQEIKQTNTDDGLILYVEALEEIDESSPLAKLNATSISDNNGGRILL
jgi:hypothetical protein